MNLQGYRTCIIDTVLSHRQNFSGRYEFLIKWKKSAPTWEPYQNLLSIESLIVEYLRENQLINYDEWGNSHIKSKSSKRRENTNILDIQDQNTRQSKRQAANQIKRYDGAQQSGLFLRHNDYFEIQYISPQKKLQRKVTSGSNVIFCKEQHFIEWKTLKKALDIRWDHSIGKWMVLAQFYDNLKGKIWIQRDILRLTNPFILLDLYERIQRLTKFNDGKVGQIIEEQIFYQKVAANSRFAVQNQLSDATYQKSVIEID